MYYGKSAQEDASVDKKIASERIRQFTLTSRTFYITITTHKRVPRRTFLFQCINFLLPRYRDRCFGVSQR